jgi:Na+/H+ antiporter NhaD/arsenite permease-like protein
MSKIYLTELKNKATKPFWQVTKPYNFYCETKGHCHMSHGLYWTEPVRRYKVPSSLFIFSSQCLSNLKFKFFSLTLLYSKCYNFIFTHSHFISFTILLSLTFSFSSLSFLISDYILLYFAEKSKDHKENEVLNKEDEIPKNQHYFIFKSFSLMFFLCFYFFFLSSYLTIFF